MKNTNFNLLKLRSNVDIDSIEMFHACLVYNTKLQPLIQKELEKWPIYLEYWNKLVANNNITRFEVQTTMDNLTIVGDYIKTPIKNENNNRTIFLLHGITNTRYWIFKQVYIFLEAGYNVVWYDARNHGESSAAFTTFGKKESHDLQDIINYIDDRYYCKNIILYGFSLGSATIIMWSELYRNYPNKGKIKLLICDSTFSELEQAYLNKVSEHAYVPTNVMLNIFRRTIKKTTGISDLKLLRPLKFLKDIPDLPVLFLHGKGDNFVKYTHSEALYDEKIRYEQPIISKILLVDQALHGQVFLLGDLDESKVEIFDEFHQSHKTKISHLILNYIDEQLS